MGHIIISNDDAVEPVLGYGLDSHIDFKNIPPALKYLLGEYKTEITIAKKQKLTAHESVITKWSNYTSEYNQNLKSYTIGDYLLETSWGQQLAYNDSCPDDPVTDIQSVVGCVGVALGQVLNYWECRVFPDSNISYTPLRFSSPLSVNFYDQDYDWDDIRAVPSSTAQFLYHCALAVESDFGDLDIGTGSNIYLAWHAFVNYFGFNASYPIVKTSYSNTQWINLLKNEIDVERPVIYSGECDTCSVGHAWVIDGYDSYDKFHCNWGWSGEDNNWYSLSDLTPGEDGDYTSDQRAIMNVYPILDACSGLSGASTICYPDTVQYSVSIPSTASVVWNVTGNLAVVGSNTNPVCNVRSTSNTGASGTITATIKNSQDQTFLTRSKTVWVGKPFTPVIDGSTYITCDSELYTEDNGKTVTWSVYGPMQIVGQTYGYRCTIEGTGNGYGWVYATSSNICQNITSELLVEVECGYLLVFSPNPASGETILSIESTSENKIVDETVVWELEVYDNTQNLKLKNSKIKGKEYRFNTSGWKEGIYIARVKYNNEVLTGKLVVKK